MTVIPVGTRLRQSTLRAVAEIRSKHIADMAAVAACPETGILASLLDDLRADPVIGSLVRHTARIVRHGAVGGVAHVFDLDRSQSSLGGEARAGVLAIVLARKVGDASVFVGENEDWGVFDTIPACILESTNLRRSVEVGLAQIVEDFGNVEFLQRYAASYDGPLADLWGHIAPNSAEIATIREQSDAAIREFNAFCAMAAMVGMPGAMAVMGVLNEAAAACPALFGDGLWQTRQRGNLVHDAALIIGENGTSRLEVSIFRNGRLRAMLGRQDRLLEFEGGSAWMVADGSVEDVDALEEAALVRIARRIAEFEFAAQLPDGASLSENTGALPVGFRDLNAPGQIPGSLPLPRR